MTLLDNSQDPQTDDTNPLEELVGENKKFKTVEDLAKGKRESDAYIRQMERRMDEMRTDYLRLKEDNESGASLRELLDQMKQTQQNSSSDNQNANEMNNKPAVTDLKEIENLFSSKIKEYEMTKKQEENYNTVKAKLQERYGRNYPEVLKQTIENLDLTEDYVNDMARRHPKALFKALGLDSENNQRQDFQTPPRSDTRNDSFAPKGAQKRTWSYYQNMKKENPVLYYDPKTLVQIQQDAIDLGDDFEDGDFATAYKN